MVQPNPDNPLWWVPLLQVPPNPEGFAVYEQPVIPKTKVVLNKALNAMKDQGFYIELGDSVLTEKTMPSTLQAIIRRNFSNEKKTQTDPNTMWIGDLRTKAYAQDHTRSIKEMDRNALKTYLGLNSKEENNLQEQQPRPSTDTQRRTRSRAAVEVLDGQSDHFDADTDPIEAQLRHTRYQENRPSDDASRYDSELDSSADHMELERQSTPTREVPTAGVSFARHSSYEQVSTQTGGETPTKQSKSGPRGRSRTKSRQRSSTEESPAATASRPGRRGSSSMKYAPRNGKSEDDSMNGIPETAVPGSVVKAESQLQTVRMELKAAGKTCRALLSTVEKLTGTVEDLDGNFEDIKHEAVTAARAGSMGPPDSAHPALDNWLDAGGYQGLITTPEQREEVVDVFFRTGI